MEAGELLGLELILGNEQMMLGNVPTRGKGALRYDKKSAVIPQIETITRQVGGCCLKPTPGHVSYNTVLVGPIVSGTSCLLGPSGAVPKPAMRRRGSDGADAPWPPLRPTPVIVGAPSHGLSPSLL